MLGPSKQCKWNVFLYHQKLEAHEKYSIKASKPLWALENYI